MGVADVKRVEELLAQADRLQVDGRLRKALEPAREAARLAAESGAGELHGLALQLQASLHLGLGERATAREVGSRAQQALEQALGEDHPDVLYGLRSLAELHEGGGEAAEAGRCWEELARRLLRAGEGAMGLTVVEAAEGVTRTLVAAGEAPRAEALLAQLCAEQERRWGEDSPRVLPLWVSLSTARQARGDLPGAVAAQEEVVRRSRALWGGQPRDGGAGLRRLSQLLRVVSPASPTPRLLLEEALEVARGLGQEGEVHLGLTLRDLARLCVDQGRWEEALGLQRQALGLFSRTLPADDPEQDTTLDELALSLETLGHLDEAARARSRAQLIRAARARARR